MKVKLVRIGNSKGLRLPRSLLDLYRVEEGGMMELEMRRDGILMRPLPGKNVKLSWEAAYHEMADEALENAEWQEWDAAAGDGLED